MVNGPEGFVPVDPPLLPDEMAIDLTGLDGEVVPVSRTTTPRIQESVLAALRAESRRPQIQESVIAALLAETKRCP